MVTQGGIGIGVEGLFNPLKLFRLHERHCHHAGLLRAISEVRANERYTAEGTSSDPWPTRLQDCRATSP